MVARGNQEVGFMQLSMNKFALQSKFKWRESLAEKLRFPVTKVILLSSNPRSGSSFLGDILTPAPVAASYFYEPLRFLYESVPRSNDDRG